MKTADRTLVLPRLSRGFLHDTKNVLNVAALNVQALSERVRRALPSPEAFESLRQLGALREQIGKLDRLVSRFAAFAAEIPGGKGPADVSAAVTDAVLLCAHEVRSRHVDVALSAEGGARALVDGQSLQALLVRMILDLLDEAPRGGWLRLAVTNAVGGCRITLESAALSGTELVSRWRGWVAEARLPGSFEADAGRADLLLP